MPKRKYGGILGPNTPGGSNPQFGNIETLPNGWNRQTSVVDLYSINENSKKWSRLTFNFPECLGIKQTLDNAAKSTSCIPSLDMDVQINIPVIRDVHLDVLWKTSSKRLNVNLTSDRLQMVHLDEDFVAILTGDDQLVASVPDMYDETKTDPLILFTDFQRVSASEVIWARLERAKDRNQTDLPFQKAVNAPGKSGWLYGKTEGGKVGLDYAQVGETEVGKIGDEETSNIVNIDNIPKGGYKLLNDHVNLFVKTHPNKPTEEAFEFRLMIDYETSSVPLSSLLVWKQQLTEFIPKQIQWRGAFVEPGSGKKNGYRFLISRGTVKETGEGTDPSSSADFPNIDD